MFIALCVISELSLVQLRELTRLCCVCSAIYEMCFGCVRVNIYRYIPQGKELFV